MENKNEKTIEYFRNSVKNAAGGYIMLHVNMMYYLTEREFVMFTYLCVSMNRYGQCTETTEQIAGAIGKCVRMIKYDLDRLQKIGVTTIDKGYHKFSRGINIDNVSLICNIIHDHPGIGQYLRGIFDDEDISKYGDILQQAIDLYDGGCTVTDAIDILKNDILQRKRFLKSGDLHISASISLFD